VVPPTPSPLVAERCAHLGNLLPQALESLRPRVISPLTPLVHAWGNPAIVLTCGVPLPAGYSPRSSQTTDVNAVRWFEQVGSHTVTWTALLSGAGRGQTVNVRLEVPTSYKDGQGAFLVDLSGPLKAALP
jgi:hypothetical protein